MTVRLFRYTGQLVAAESADACGAICMQKLVLTENNNSVNTSFNFLLFYSIFSMFQDETQTNRF